MISNVLILIVSYSAFYYFNNAGCRLGKKVNGLYREERALEKALDIVDNICWSEGLTRSE